MAWGLGGGKSSSSSSTNQTQTTVANNPDWLEPQVQGLGDKISTLSGMDPSTFVAGADPLQLQAGAAAGGLGQNGGAYDTANATLTGMANGGAHTQDNVATVHGNTLLSNLGSYMSPYTNDVVNTTLQGFDRNAGQQTAAAQLARAQDATFGGSGGSIEAAMLASNQGLDRASTEAGLRDRAFTTGAQLSDQDANRRQQAQLANQAAFNSQYQFNAGQGDTNDARRMAAAQGLTTTDQNRNADMRANIATMGDMGGVLQGIAQNQAGAPLSTVSALTTDYNNLSNPLSLLHGETSTLDGTTKTKGKNASFKVGGGL